jgi:hypothetical protein
MYQQHPLVAQKILNWVMRLYQWRPPVAEKILNWLQDCTGTINQLLKRSWIGLQDCVPAASSSLKRYSIGLQDCTRRHCWYDGCSQVQWNHYYYYYYIWQEYPLPFSQQLLSPAKMYVCQNTAKKLACAIHQRSLHKPTTVDSVRTMHMCV